MDLPKPLECTVPQPEDKLDTTVATKYSGYSGKRYAARVTESQLRDAQCVATAFVSKIANICQWSVRLVD